jgi:hypothetical protein
LDSTTGSVRATRTWLIAAISSPRPRVISKKNRSAVTAAFKLMREVPLSDKCSW